MAVNKTINGSTNNNQWTYKLEVSETATNIQNNTSTVQVKAYIGRSSSQSYLGGNYNVSVTCDGQSQSQSGNIPWPTYVNGGAWLELKTFTFTVSHNSDGTKTASVSSSFGSSDFTPSYASASGSIVLSPLHKPPTLSLSAITERNNILSGIDGNTFVNNISIKIFTLNYAMYDGATPQLLEIYDKNGNKINALTNLDTSIGSIRVDFKNTPLSNNVITNNKTQFTIKFTDSLNGSITITTPEYTVIPYFAPNLITTASNVKRNGQTTGKAILNLTGQFYNATIGNTTNAITLSFKYWTGSTEPSTYYTIPSSADTGTGNNISISKWEFKKNNTTVTDLDKSNSYKFKIKAVDSFGSEYESVIELTLAKGEWLMAKFKDRIDFKEITVDGYNPFEYSTSEKKIGIWDGKPLYRKIIKDTLANNHVTISDSYIVRISGFVKSTHNQWWPTPGIYSDSGYNNFIYLNTARNGFTIDYNSYYSSSSQYEIVVEYTKTTD